MVTKMYDCELFVHKCIYAELFEGTVWNKQVWCRLVTREQAVMSFKKWRISRLKTAWFLCLGWKKWDSQWFYRMLHKFRHLMLGICVSCRCMWRARCRRRELALPSRCCRSASCAWPSSPVWTAWPNTETTGQTSSPASSSAPPSPLSWWDSHTQWGWDLLHVWLFIVTHVSTCLSYIRLTTFALRDTVSTVHTWLIKDNSCYILTCHNSNLRYCKLQSN